MQLTRFFFLLPAAWNQTPIQNVHLGKIWQLLCIAHRSENQIFAQSLLLCLLDFSYHFLDAPYPHVEVLQRLSDINENHYRLLRQRAKAVLA